MTPSFIAIDLGTSTIKGAVVEPETMRIRNIQRIPFPAPLPGLPPLFHEVDPSEIMAAVRTLIQSLLSSAPGCQGVVSCGQMGGLILANEYGEPLSNYISWKDQRATGQHPSGKGRHFDVLLERLGIDMVRELGNEVRSGVPLSYLFWLIEEKRPIAPAAIACSLGDFVIANLCHSMPCTHVTNAAGTLNLRTRDWHWAAFSRLGLMGLTRWPKLADITEPVGCFQSGSDSYACYVNTGDHQTSLAGASLAPSELSINLSTGSQVSMIASQVDPGNCQIRPYFDGEVLRSVTHIPGGRSLNTMVQLLTELPERLQLPVPDPWAVINQEVARVAGTDLNVDLAFYPSPVGHRGEISNIRDDNLTIGSLFYAAYRNLADNCETCALRISPPRAWNRIVFSGGLAQRTEVLRRMILDRLRSPYRLSFSGEETLLGLLAQAMVIRGVSPTVTEAAALLSVRET